jgi:Uma2 family endonuclease
MSTGLNIPEAPEHMVIAGVSWDYYEQTLAEIGNQPIQVSFLDGVMELMSPLPKHGNITKAIGYLVAILAMEREIPFQSFGSATFRRKDKAAGSEPDDCFHFYEIDSVKGMERFDPQLHRAPDLWVEVDVMSASVAREPIYSRLGVPEVWRYSNGRLVIRLLTPDGAYTDSVTSRAFPFLPIDTFAAFIPKVLHGNMGAVLIEFREWLRSL